MGMPVDISSFDLDHLTMLGVDVDALVARAADPSSISLEYEFSGSWEDLTPVSGYRSVEYDRIIDIFNDECGHLKIDKKLVKTLASFDRDYINQNQNHVEFYGGVLIGTPRVAFTTGDYNRWFDEVLRADDVAIRKGLRSTPYIDPTWKVTTDPLNMSVCWLIHKLATSKELSPTDAEIGIRSAIRILHYKFLGSLIFNFFPYEPSREVAEATYAALSRKFMLREAGSWSTLLDMRARDIVSQSSPHYNTIQRFTDDRAVIYMMNDIQSRIRSIVRNIRSVFEVVYQAGKRITTTDSHFTAEGEVKVKDVVRATSAIRRAAKDSMVDRNTFIRPVLLNSIFKIVHTAPRNPTIQLMEYLVNNVGPHGDKEVLKVVDEIIVHAISHMEQSSTSGDFNYQTFLVRLKALYTSSRTNNKTVVYVRHALTKMIRRSTDLKADSTISAVRTAVVLYIVLRAFASKTYQNS